MSLADQSQQWFPTSVQVTVHQARNLRPKGKNGTNDAYAIMQVAKDKFSTSVSEKCLDPVWKEEASFDLPLFHPGNGDRCTLYIIVMHRAHVGLDKFLGQAVVNLLEQHDNDLRKKTEWFKLVDKSGKEDKVRGEVLLDIQFLRNNMSASMMDLSMQDKPRSRMSKLKDKVRGKKKDGFSDSASAIVPSVSIVLTDSEGEADTQSITSHQSEGVKKKSKLKTLFAPKSNLQRNISQSMSTLGTLPEKNSSLSGSRSSGLNVDSPEGKKKFKFLGHKRTGSSDSKVSLGAFSLLGRSKQKDIDKTCINGNHVYAEKKEPMENSGDTLSLNSSGQGSVEDVRKYREVGVDVPSHQHESTNRAVLEQQHHQEDEEEKRKQAEEWRIAEAKRLEDEEKHRVEVQRLREEHERRQQEEQERKRRFLEDEARREEEKRKQEEAAGNQRLEEDRRRAEEQKQQEEASMSDRLSSLFGMIRKKEEKKEELPATAPFSELGDPDGLISARSPNPFEDIPLSSDPPVSSDESPADDQKFSRKTQMPSAMAFLNRSAKVSAVKPRFTQSLESEPADCQTPSQLYPSSAESTLSSVPSESPDTFSSLHSSLAPAIPSQSPSGSPRGSIEDLSSAGSSPTMSDKRRRAPTQPSYATQNGVPVKEATSPTSVEIDGPLPNRKLSLPLPDYETLFPQKRHGVQGQTRWDHIIAEVNQKSRDSAEMSVDGPEENAPSRRTTSLQQESPAIRHYQTQPQETKPISSKKSAAPAPPNSVTPPYLRSAADFFQSSSRDSLSGMSRNGARKALLPPAATHTPRLISQTDLDTTPRNDQREITKNKDAPTASPRQKASGKEPAQQEDSAVTPDKYMNSYIQTSSLRSMDTKDRQVQENFDFDPFPITELLTKDPWAQLKPNKEADDFFAGGVQKEQKVEDRGMTPGDLDSIFGQEKQTDLFADFNGKDSEYMKKDEDSKQDSPVIQKMNLQRRKMNLSSTTPSDITTSKSRQEPETTITTAYKGLSARGGRNESITPKPPADAKTQSNFYGGEDQFGAEPFSPTVTFAEPLQVVMEEAKTQSNFYGGEDQFGAEPFSPTVTFAEPLQVVIEEVEPAPPAGGLSGGKSPLRAWVSPTDVVSAQSSNGDGLAVTPRRPHPVKPMNTDNQYPISPPGVKDIKVRERTPGKTQVADTVGSGPFTQLTQEELITLVVRQQADLSNKDSKIVELEEYIDNLLVRVIDEQPGILQALNLTPE